MANKKIIAANSSIILVTTLVLGFLYLDRGLNIEAKPADFACLDENQGQFSEVNLETNNIYGVGLAYAKHINEIAADFDPTIAPPIFKKTPETLNLSANVKTAEVAVPGHMQLLKAIEQVEPEIASTLETQDIQLLPLLDYEAELAFVLLEDIQPEQLSEPDFAPKVGFLITNDLSARSVAILGENQQNRFDYWGASKSQPGFTPINGQIWIPETPSTNGIPCINLTTHVDGQLKQKENTSNLINTPLDMLKHINERFQPEALKAGDMVLTGTPGGVILNVPRWKSRIANIIGLDRFQKLKINQKPKSADKFLKAGNEITISGEWLGDVNVSLVDQVQTSISQNQAITP